MLCTHGTHLRGEKLSFEGRIIARFIVISKDVRSESVLISTLLYRVLDMQREIEIAMPDFSRVLAQRLSTLALECRSCLLISWHNTLRTESQTESAQH